MRVYEDTIFSREFKYDCISNIFYPSNESRIKDEENLIFKLNQNSKFNNNKGTLVVIEDDQDKIENNTPIKNEPKEQGNDNGVYFSNNEIIISKTITHNDIKSFVLIDVNTFKFFILSIFYFTSNLYPTPRIVSMYFPFFPNLCLIFFM